jgi:hypothetical protein
MRNLASLCIDLSHRTCYNGTLCAANGLVLAGKVCAVAVSGL